MLDKTPSGCIGQTCNITGMLEFEVLRSVSLVCYIGLCNESVYSYPIDQERKNQKNLKNNKLSLKKVDLPEWNYATLKKIFFIWVT